MLNSYILSFGPISHPRYIELIVYLVFVFVSYRVSCLDLRCVQAKPKTDKCQEPDGADEGDWRGQFLERFLIWNGNQGELSNFDDQ